MDVAEPLNERDLVTLDRAVKRLRLLRFEASVTSDAAQGQATLYYVESRNWHADTVQFEIQKYSAGLVHRWLLRVARSHGATMVMQDLGRVSEKVLLFALTKAEALVERAQDVKALPISTIPVKPSDRREIEALGKIAATLQPNIRLRA